MNSSEIDSTTPTRAISQLQIDFYSCTLNGIHWGNSLILESLGKPNHVHYFEWCYCDCGVQIQVVSGYIAYVFIHIQESLPQQGYCKTPYHFSAFPGELLYQGKPIDRILLQDCELLVASFNGIQYRQYSYTQRTNSPEREIGYSVKDKNGTVVFDYNAIGLKTLILYSG